MFARIAKFEGGDPARLDDAIQGVRAMMEGERPPGLEGARESWMLVDRTAGKGLGITLFDDEDALRRGDEALNAMTPPTAADLGGSRTSVEIYEVAIRKEF